MSAHNVIICHPGLDPGSRMTAPLFLVILRVLPKNLEILRLKAQDDGGGKTELWEGAE